VAPATGFGRVIPARVRPQTSQTYYHRNQQYSIVGLTNAAGTLVERYTYSAYGTLGIYAANGTVRSSSTYANRYTYTGREWDAELRLYHFRARWYDPATGGFVSRDPLGYVDGMSLYRGYFWVSASDPDGTDSKVAGTSGTRVMQRPDMSCYLQTKDEDGNWVGSQTIQCPAAVNVFIEEGTTNNGHIVSSNPDAKIWREIHTEFYEIDQSDCLFHVPGQVNKTTEALLACSSKKNKCVKQLTFAGHGYYDNTIRLSIDDLKAVLAHVMFCAECEIWINSCLSGAPPPEHMSGRPLAEIVHEITGCTVYGTKACITGFRRSAKIWKPGKELGENMANVELFGLDCFNVFPNKKGAEKK